MNIQSLIIKINSQSSVLFSLILLFTISLTVSCSNDASDNKVTENTNLEDVSVKPTNTSESENTPEENPQITETKSTKSPTPIKINPTKLTGEQIEEVKKVLPGKTIIADHAFQINLKDIGQSLFVPVTDIPKLELHLVKDGQVKQTLPQPEDVTAWNFYQLDAVSFENINPKTNDTGILLISQYTARPQKTPFPVAMFYTQSGDYFEINKEITTKLIDKQVKTIQEARSLLKNEL